MSKFKKMKLVPFDEETNRNSTDDILNTIRLSTDPYLKSASSLDFDIKNILESNMEDYLKSKLYAMALKKFLIYKDKYQETPIIESNQKKNLTIATPIKIKQTRKRKAKNSPKHKNTSKSKEKKPKYSTPSANINTPLASTSNINQPKLTPKISPNIDEEIIKNLQKISPPSKTSTTTITKVNPIPHQFKKSSKTAKTPSPKKPRGENCCKSKI